MKSITASLALSQLKQNRKRTAVTIVGIVLSVAMITAVFGFAAGGIDALRSLVSERDMANYRPIFITMSVIFGSIIMIASVIVISNAFRISAAERLRQFGILKSVGATSRQISKIVLFEALFLSAVSIPAGMFVGMLVQWLGSSIGDTLLAPMNKLIADGLSIHMRFVLSWEALLVALCLSLLTIMLSAYFPARKAARIPAIDAIRLTPEIKPARRKPRGDRLVRAAFGFEGTLAAKSIRRSKRSYRAMVTALSISVILFLVCGSLETQLTMSINQTYDNVNASSITLYNAAHSTPGLPYGPLDAQGAQRLTDQLADYPDTQLYGVGVNGSYTIRVADTALTSRMRMMCAPEEPDLPILLVMTDPAHYAGICRAAGVPEGSNILINSYRQTLNGKQTEFQPVSFSGQTLTLYRDGTATELALHAQLTGTQVPQEIAYVAYGSIAVVVPDIDVISYSWFGNSADTAGFVAHAEAVLTAFTQQADGNTDARPFYYVTDVTAITDMTRSLTKLITIFLYGFVGMLSLIGLTSILSAIAANVRLRAREFAVLASVGMTQGGIRRMLALESVMSACKALLFGAPLGSLAMFLVYQTLTQRISYQFVYPWQTLLEAVAAVFLIALIATQYSAAKLRGSSVMEVIRSTEGV